MPSLAGGDSLVRYDSGGAQHHGLVRDGVVYKAVTPLSFETELGPEIGPIESVRLLAPCLPRNLICSGKNPRQWYQPPYDPAGHGGGVPSEPLLWPKPTSTIVGPGEDLNWPAWSSPRFFFPSAELAIVIGKESKDVLADDASDYILGMTACCEADVTTGFDPPLTVYGDIFAEKCFDAATSLGPAIIPFSTESVSVSCAINGEIFQAAVVEDLYFGPAQLLSAASRVLTLHPGDVIACGGAPPVDPKTGDYIQVNLVEPSIKRGATVTVKVGPLVLENKIS